jgi:hypothetical protein
MLGSFIAVILPLHPLIKKGVRKGRIAQLVQSTCLTSRGSEVRILLRPPGKPLTPSGFFIFRTWLRCTASSTTTVKPLVLVFKKKY